MTNILKVLKERVNQLEESYHFNIKEYSFVYKDKKAFISNVSERLLVIQPFMYHRKKLDNFLNQNNLIGQGNFTNPDQMNVYFNKCMGIIGNMLDKTRMGSVEYYLNHIWETFDRAVNNTESQLPMQNFVNDISNIITMIDYSVESQLSLLTESDRESLLAQAITETIDPNLEVIGVYEVTKDGSIRKIKTKPKEDEPDFDLKHMKPLNIKEI